MANDGKVSLSVAIENETVWLTQEQISQLFDTARSSIAYHIGNIFREGELDKKTSVEIFDRSTQEASRPPMYYNLDVIISVGYRVKSQRGVEFRKWANSVLKDYILKGYAVNDNRLKQLGEVVRLMQRAQASLDSKQVLTVIENYSKALDLLDAYDHQTISRPEGEKAVYVLSYEECLRVIDSMRFGNESELFGAEKDDSFKRSMSIVTESIFVYLKTMNLQMMSLIKTCTINL